MKKFFTLFDVLFLAGSLMAADITATYVFTSEEWTATLNGEEANWISGKNGNNFEEKGLKVTTAENGAFATCPSSYDNIKKVVVTYTTPRAVAGSIEIQIGTNDSIVRDCVINQKDDTLEYNYPSTQSGVVKIKVNCTTNYVWVKSVAITYEYTSAVSEIVANKLDLGTQIIAVGDDEFSSDQTIEVAGANLSEIITVDYQSDYFTVTESSLSADGGILHLHIATATAVAFADTICLSSGGIVTKVPVVAKIKKNVALSGTAATLNAGSSVPVTVDGISAVKVGSATQGGTMTITVPAYAAKLRFYAAAWAELPGTVYLSAPKGVGLSADEITLVDDAGVTGSPVTFTLDALTHAAFTQEITLTGVESETAITLTSGSIYRFLVWGAKYDVGNVNPTGLDKPEKPAKARKTVEDGQIVVIRDGVRYNLLGTRL